MLLLILFSTILLELVAIKIYMPIAKKFNIMDHPNQRKIHTRSKPRGAGITFFISFLIGFLLLNHFLKIDFPFKITLWLILGGIIYLMGFLDDIFNLNPYLKFFVQIAVAVVFVLFVGKATFFIKIKGIQYIISILWIVGIMNSFNLLDNMDGLSGGIALITTIVFALINYHMNNTPLFYLFILLAAVMIGFLPMNYYPSQVFMGDSGSLFIGYVMATLSIIGVYTEFSRLRHLPAIIPLLLLSVPLYDSFSVMYIRLKNKKSLFVGDKNHFSHRLYNLGLSHKHSVLYIYLVTFATSISSFLLLMVNWKGAIILLLQDITLFVLLSILISKKTKDKRK